MSFSSIIESVHKLFKYFEKLPANQIVALARDENKALDLKEKGIEIRLGNYHETDSLLKAFKGIDTLLLISSSDFNNRLQQQINAINAAKEAGVKHIIYTSTGINNSENSAIQFIINDHFKTSEKIKESGLKYTILNNTLYSDVLPMFLGQNVLETGVLLPAGEGKVPFATAIKNKEFELYDNTLATLLGREETSLKDYLKSVFFA